MKKIISVIMLILFTFSVTSCGFLNNGEGKGALEPDALGEAGYTEENTDTAKDSTTAEDNSSAGQGGDTDNADGKLINVTLYFPTIDNSALKTEERDVLVVEGAILKACILALAEGPKSQLLRKPIPGGTEIRGISIHDNVAIVDLSEEFLNSSGLDEVTSRLSIVNTLTGIEGVDKVRLRIEGEDMIGPSGMPLGDMEPAVLDAEGYPVPGETKTVTLYFSDSQAMYVVGEKREIQLAKGASLEEKVLLELMAGPRTDELWSAIPEGTKLLSVSTKNGVCTVDFSKEYVENSPGGTASERMAIYSVVNTLTGLEGVQKVQFLIEGKKREIYTHAVFDEPFERDESVMAK
ncbi:MAG: GerMN domain-containing protein [Clostridiaceae bacterium]|nr:GerMN domain-containing protein [Clostridiaceae bacterium]